MAVAGIDITSAVILLFVKDSPNIVVVRHSATKEYMLPGGLIDRGENPWDAATREWLEETGYPLIDLRHEKRSFYRYQYRHRDGSATNIYIGKTSHGCPLYDIKKVKHHETDQLTCVPISVLLSGKLYKLRNYVYNSLKEIFGKIILNQDKELQKHAVNEQLYVYKKHGGSNDAKYKYLKYKFKCDGLYL